MVEPRAAFADVTRHARHAKRSAGRLLLSGVGFSAAYFLDPDQGPARRRQASNFFRRTRQRLAHQSVPDPRPGPAEPADAMKNDRLVPHPGIAPSFGSNGRKVVSPW
jgi:hypothetical protein